MTLDLSNRREWNFDDLSVWAKYLDAWRSERLRGFHAADDTSDSSSISGNNFDVVFSVERP